MTEISMPLIELLQKPDEGDFPRVETEAVLQTLIEHDVDGMIGAPPVAREGLGPAYGVAPKARVPRDPDRGE